MPAGLADRDLVNVVISYLYELRLTGLPAAGLPPELPNIWDRWLVCFRLWQSASRIEGLPSGAGAGCELCRTWAAALSRSQPPTHPDALALTCRCFDQWAARMRDRRPGASPLDFPGMLSLVLLKPDAPAAEIRGMLGEQYRVLAERRLTLSLAGMRRLYPDAYGEEFVARQREYLTRGSVEVLLLTSPDVSSRRATAVRDDIRRQLGVADAFENHLHMPDSPGETFSNAAQFFGMDALRECYEAIERRYGCERLAVYRALLGG